MKKYTIAELKDMRESEDHVEFKKGEGGNVSYNGAGKDKIKDRRRCILGYVAALCNEGGGSLVIGMHDKHPHKVIGTRQCENAIGQLESDIYRDLGIRVSVYELYEDDVNKKGRVLVIGIPSRPIGRIYKFEDVALMRVGEELKPMDDKTYISIIQEQEPDFSEQICLGVSLKDLDKNAISVLKEKYALKQNNPSFRNIEDEQALSDLRLINKEGVTNAAVLLVGKEDIINKYYPQAKVMLEYRNNESQINFDKREQFGQPFFLMIDNLWKAINVRNGSIPIRDGAYIFDIPFFNEEVIREVLNNAFAHRDYRRSSEIIIKQYPSKLVFTNAGGFPQGVNINNLLVVPSTPRNRLLADVLSKTGIVERSGQGIDKIFLYTLSEGKSKPDYSYSDDFMVTVVLSAMVRDKAFAMFIQDIQRELPEDKSLSVFDILTLCELRDGIKNPKNKKIVHKLESLGCIEKHGKTSATYYLLPRRYYEMDGDMVSYFEKTDWDIKQVWAVIMPYLEKYGKAKRADFNKLVGEHLSDKQMRGMIDKFKELEFLRSEGSRGQTVYYLGDGYKNNSAIINEALKLGLEELKKKGKL